jgi:putative intracellular protease/amidase
MSREVGYGAAVGMAAPEPSLAGRWGPKLWDVWQHVDACPAPCLDLRLVRGGTRSARYR